MPGQAEAAFDEAHGAATPGSAARGAADPAARRSGLESARPVAIGDNAWLGGGAIVCPGVTIGNDSVIGAGAVVTKDIPAGSIAVGNPACVTGSVYDRKGE